MQSKAIETQEELAAALLEEGIEVTQATVSRDIKELMLIKIPTGDGHYRYALSPEENVVLSRSRINRLFQDSLIKVDHQFKPSCITYNPWFCSICSIFYRPCKMD